MTLELHTFKGSHEELGLQHGEAFRVKIHDLANERLNILHELVEKTSTEQIKTVTGEILMQIEIQVPEVLKEIRAIGVGADIELWKLIIAGGYSDVLHRLSDSKEIYSISQKPNECTIVPIKQNKNLLIAGTWDSHASAESSLVLIKRIPNKGPITLALTTAGWPMQQGITSTGIGFAIANLIGLKSHLGITYIAALPALVSSKSILSISQKIVRQRLCSGRFYSFCDARGNYLGIETDGKQYWSESSLRPHTNHYIFKKALTREGRQEYSLASEKRRMSAVKKISELSDTRPQSIIKALAFNDGTEDSIMKLGKGREDRSCALFVLDPKSGSLTVAVDKNTIQTPLIYHI